MGMQLIRADALTPGMVLAEDLCGSKGELLLAGGQTLTARHIARLTTSAFEMIYIRDKNTEETPPARPAISHVLRSKTTNALGAFFRVAAGNKVEYPHIFQTIRQHLDEMIDEILQNQNVSANIVDLREYDDYTYRHSVNVAVFSIMVGVSMGLSRTSLYRLGMGALLHDVGKMFVSKDILQKPGKLTDEEYAEMKNHPGRGYEYLLKNWELPREALMGVLMHHERIDGSGYPYGLTDEKTTLEGKLIAICDVYDAMTSERPYRKPLSPSEAMEHIIGNSGILYDAPLIESFFNKVEPYPIGVRVLLSNGLRGTVVQNHPKALIRPLVAVVDQGDAVEETYLDLLHNPRLWDVTIVGIDR